MNREPISNLPGRRLATAFMQLLLTGGLVVALLVAASAISMGIANAEDMQAIVRPGTGLMIALLLVAIGVMCALSAAAVHFGNRSRR